MHQQLPSAPAVPHSKAVLQRSQVSVRSGKVLAGIIAALSGFIAGKINRAGMTALRRWARL
jgi:hypothetical protein